MLHYLPLSYTFWVLFGCPADNTFTFGDLFSFLFVFLHFFLIGVCCVNNCWLDKKHEAPKKHNFCMIFPACDGNFCGLLVQSLGMGIYFFCFLYFWHLLCGECPQHTHTHTPGNKSRTIKRAEPDSPAVRQSGKACLKASWQLNSSLSLSFRVNFSLGLSVVRVYKLITFQLKK